MRAADQLFPKLHIRRRGECPKPFSIMKNLLNLFLILFVLTATSCSKESNILSDSLTENTIQTRSSTSVEMNVASEAYFSTTLQLEVNLTVEGDFSQVEVESTQTLLLEDNTTITLEVASYDGSEGSLQIFFNAPSAPGSALAEVQEIIIEDGIVN